MASHTFYGPSDEIFPWAPGCCWCSQNCQPLSELFFILINHSYRNISWNCNRNTILLKTTFKTLASSEISRSHKMKIQTFISFRFDLNYFLFKLRWLPLEASGHEALCCDEKNNGMFSAHIFVSKAEFRLLFTWNSENLFKKKTIPVSILRN